MSDFDIVTLGAGSGGVRASRMAAVHGARAAVVEAGRLGGTCVNVGCVPKKLMVYASHFREEMALARGFGWSVGEPRFDWAAFVAKRDAEVRRLNGVYERLLHGAGVTLLRGRARVIDPHTVEVEGKRVTAEHIVIATGARPARPVHPGAEHGIVSDDVFTLKEQPKRVLIVGGGYIGVEFAGVFRGMGSEVTLAHRGPHLLRGFDEDARAFLAEEMRKKGIRVAQSAIVEAIDRRGEELVCELSNGDEIAVDVVLHATGRVPNVEGLGLEEVGVALGEHGAVVVDRLSRTNVPSIHAIGDVTNRMNLTPVAIAEGAALARTLFCGQPTAPDHAGVPTAVFSQPPLSAVGLTEAEARREHDVHVYASEFRPLKHTVSGSDERMFMKLVVDAKTDRVLGVHVVGMDAAEIVQGFAVALKAGVTKAQLDATIGIHPTAAEELVTMRDKRELARMTTA